MDQLEKLCQYVPPAGRNQLPERFKLITTPLKAEVLELELKDLPDKRCAQFVIWGISEGFRIGFQYSTHQWSSANRNMQSTLSHPRVVEEYLEKEIALGKVVGPASKDLQVQINRFGVIPKGHQKDKWWLILDLSYPTGHSVNDGIELELCSLSYTSVDHAAGLIIAQGGGTLQAKLDLKSAYRMVPVHPEDRQLLGMKWKDKTWLDTTLLFRLRSAPKLFNFLANCLQWIFQKHIPGTVIHYLDDFLFVGAPDTDVCSRSLSLAVSKCHDLGVRISLEKLEGPATQLSFLGILLDTEKLEVRLPDEKLRRLQLLLAEWRDKRSCTKRDLLSLIGTLQHACRVVPPGRSFLRRMIDLSKVAKQLYHHVRLNAEFRSDLEWWVTFLPGWNGVEMLSSLCK